jgi:outer membrane protein TolC
MTDRRDENRRRLKELAEAERLKRAAAEPEIARKEAALAKARADLARANDQVARLEAELEALKPEPANDDEHPGSAPA